MSDEFLGMNVIVCVGVGFYTGKQKRAAVLEEYDESNDTYVGVTHFQDDEFAQTLKHLGKGAFAPGRIANVAVAVRIPGLRRYPYAVEPNYAFQFVLPGEDATPLREIMQRNADAFTSGKPIGQESGEEEPLWKKLGFKSYDKWLKMGSPQQ